MLTGGSVYIAWASFCDIPDYWGWFLRYDATSLVQTAVFNVAPNGSMGGIWMSGGAPAVDSSGSIFLATGNGTFDNSTGAMPPLAPNNDFGQSFLKLDPTTLAVQDFYTPSQAVTWSGADNDVGAAGVTSLPDGAGPPGHPNLVIGADKEAHFWMIDRSNMQAFHSGSDPVVQYTTVPLCVSVNKCVMSTPAYWNGTIYVAVSGGKLYAFKLAQGLVPTTLEGVMAPSSQTTEAYGFPSPTPMVSGSPNGNAIVWAMDNGINGTITAELGPAVLRAYDANDLSVTLFSSAIRSADAGGAAIRFTAPVIANGHVYVGGDGQVTVYGLSQ